MHHFFFSQIPDRANIVESLDPMRLISCIAALVLSIKLSFIQCPSLTLQSVSGGPSLRAAVCASRQLDPTAGGGGQAETGCRFCPDGDGHFSLLSTCGRPGPGLPHPACL